MGGKVGASNPQVPQVADGPDELWSLMIEFVLSQKGWWVSVCAAVVALVFRVPVGRTTALAYSGAEAGTMPAGSADVPGEEEEPQPASAVMTASARRRKRKASKRGDRRCGIGRSYSRTHMGASRGEMSRCPARRRCASGIACTPSAGGLAPLPACRSCWD